MTEIWSTVSLLTTTGLSSALSRRVVAINGNIHFVVLAETHSHDLLQQCKP